MLGIFVHKLLVDMLLKIFDFGNVRIILVVYVACHEVNALEPPLDLTQIHLKMDVIISNILFYFN